MAVFTTMTEVQEAINKFEDLNNQLGKDKFYLEKTKSRLNKLIKIVEDNEKKFYGLLKKKYNIADLNDLQAELKKQFKALEDLENKTPKIVEHTQSVVIKKTMDDILNSDTVKKVFGSDKNILNKIITSDELGTLLNLDYSKFKKNNSKLKFDFTITMDKKGILSFNSKESLPLNWVKEVKERFYNKAGEKNTKGSPIKEDLVREEIINYVREKTLNSATDLKNKVINEMLDKRYDVNISEASIKGFIGETRANVAFDLICGGDVSIPTGNVRQIKETISKKKNAKNIGSEISVDMIVKNAKFQIKNYTELFDKQKNGYFLFDGDMSAGKFITDRMKVNTGNMSGIKQPTPMIYQILINFYGAIQYNQPKFDADPDYKLLYDSLSQKSSDVMTKLMYHYLDNIIKISETFQGNNALFGEKKLYYNTFFLYKDKLVPSSAILKAIVYELDNEKDREFLDANFYKKLQVSESPTLYIKNDKNEYVKESESQQKKRTAQKLANKVKIKYDIKIYAEKILKFALAKIS